MNKIVKKVIIGVACVAVVGGLAFGGNYLLNTMRYRQIISEIELNIPDLAQIQNGTFNGSFDAILVAADVDVTVENHRIVEIVINDHYHGNWEPAPRAEAVIIDVVNSQSLDVDAIAGATNSSLVILSAVQNALEGAAN